MRLKGVEVEQEEVRKRLTAGQEVPGGMAFADPLVPEVAEFLAVEEVLSEA